MTLEPVGDLRTPRASKETAVPPESITTKEHRPQGRFATVVFTLTLDAWRS
jgi:hypothetical protein